MFLLEKFCMLLLWIFYYVKVINGSMEKGGVNK